MGNRLSKIYTRTGDDGSTGLGDGVRVPKEHLRVEAYGTVDEANSAIGVVLAVPGLPDAVRTTLLDVQHDLFDLGGELCIPGHRIVTASYVERLEQALDGFNEDLPPLKDFILPGGGVPPRAHGHAPRRAARVVARARRGGCTGSAAIPEPAVGPAVRRRAHAGAARARERSPLASPLTGSMPRDALPERSRNPRPLADVAAQAATNVRPPSHRSSRSAIP